MREDDGASRAVNGSKESKNHEKGDDDGMSNCRLSFCFSYLLRLCYVCTHFY